MRIPEISGAALSHTHDLAGESVRSQLLNSARSRKALRLICAVGTAPVLRGFLSCLLLFGSTTAIPVTAEEINEPPGLDLDVGDPGEIAAEDGAMAELIAEMAELSQQAAARSEEVKQLEVEIELGQEHLRQHQEAVQRTSREAGQAEAAVGQLRNSIDQVAGARYRTSLMDPVTTFLGSENPQVAIDRAAFLATLSRQHVSQVDELLAANEAAADSRRAADLARTEARSQLDELDLRRARLGQEQKELQEQVETLQLQVDALDRETRELWERKNDPVMDVELGELVGSPVAVAAVQAAMGQLGAPYGWGAAGPDVFDCSGLIYWAYGEQGKSIPRTSQAQLAGGAPVERDQLQPGDVVGYHPGATHVGLYIGQGLVVHASDYGIPVQVVPVDSMPWFGASRF